MYRDNSRDSSNIMPNVLSYTYEADGLGKLHNVALAMS